MIQTTRIEETKNNAKGVQVVRRRRLRCGGPAEARAPTKISPSHVTKLIISSIYDLRVHFVFIRWPVNHLRNALCKCSRLLSKSDLEEPVLANVISQPVGAIVSQNRKSNGTDVIARTRQAGE